MYNAYKLFLQVSFLYGLGLETEREKKNREGTRRMRFPKDKSIIIMLPLFKRNKV